MLCIIYDYASLVCKKYQCNFVCECLCHHLDDCVLYQWLVLLVCPYTVDIQTFVYRVMCGLRPGLYRMTVFVFGLRAAANFSLSLSLFRCLCFPPSVSFRMCVTHKVFWCSAYTKIKKRFLHFDIFLLHNARVV